MQIHNLNGQMALVPNNNEVQVLINALYDYINRNKDDEDTDHVYLANRMVTSLRTTFEH